MSRELAAQMAVLEGRERMWGETVWAPELAAQARARPVHDWWDAVNAAGPDRRWEVLARLPVDEVALPGWSDAEALPFGATRRWAGGVERVLRGDGWPGWVAGFGEGGWRIDRMELRHRAYTPEETGRPATSRWRVTVHLTHEGRLEAAALDGEVEVEWGEGDRTGLKRVSVGRMTWDRRTGGGPFEVILEDDLSPPVNAHSVDPLLVHDLDGDGHPEVILAGKGWVYRRQDDGTYRGGPLGRAEVGLISAAVLGDFDGDGVVDLLVTRHEGVVLLAGSPGGTFDVPGRLVFPAPRELVYPMVLTCGDVDGDGDLDVFLGQYRVPYEAGSMPTPFHDANDGHPAYLLLNDGTGRLTDGTVAAGLGGKRHRRTYSASLVDLKGNGALDLVVVSDFAGIDVYENDGRGRFTDRTRDWIEAPHAFGMAHVLADFDRGGRLDLLMMGMTSPTVSRLEHLGLWHPEMAVEDRPMRSQMAHGNRLYRAGEGERFWEVSGMLGIADTGWSWGCAALDADNDGLLEVVVMTGLESRDTVEDYESHYWLYDAHMAGSEPDPAAYVYFMGKFGRTRGRGQSYGGYELNRFLAHRGAAGFVEMGHLLGLGWQEDGRHVVATDLDLDGRVDLVTLGFEAWPGSRHRLRILRSRVEGAGSWIGFRFRESREGGSPVGVRVEVHAEGRVAVGTVVTGDGYRSQHPSTLHFGLGSATEVERVVIRWPGSGRRRTTLMAPAMQRYHEVGTPPRGEGVSEAVSGAVSEAQR
ncbi:MAG: CRTAC1 family protein [Verrucomicrobiae bacterium]|nr:CRTAC1 family protein [Verrucomicrobiae bacterium]